MKTRNPRKPRAQVSVLFNEPKLLKLILIFVLHLSPRSFSTLQRAEIAEIVDETERLLVALVSFSTLQRAEIAEIIRRAGFPRRCRRFSTLQRAEIAEIVVTPRRPRFFVCFSTLQRAEIAEIWRGRKSFLRVSMFQYSSTSRNC